MIDNMTIGAATSLVLGSGRTGEAVDARRTVPPVDAVKGTGLPFAGFGTTSFGCMGVVGGGTEPDQVHGTGVVRVRIAADLGIPPRRWPPRC